MTVIAQSCSHATTSRDFSKRRYHACTKNEVNDQVGMFCHRRCNRYKVLRSHVGKNCSEWTTDILDMKEKEDFEKIKNANFILINEVEVDKN